MDEYIGERSVGEVVSGRVVDVRGERAKVELGDGIMADCRMPQAQGEELAVEPAAPAARPFVFNRHAVSEMEAGRNVGQIHGAGTGQGWADPQFSNHQTGPG